MRRFLYVVVVLVIGFIGFRLGFSDGPKRELVSEGLVEPTATPTGEGPLVAEADEPEANPARDRLLRRIAESDTYLPVMIQESDSVLRRWPERRTEPLGVFIEPTSIEGVTAQKVRAVQDAFRRWERVPEIPIDFVYTSSPDRADVTVHWIEAFPEERAGQARVQWRSDGWIEEGTLTLATHTPQGHLMDTDAVFTVALHEIGHLLGLGHSDEPADVMYHTTGVHDLTRRDRQTAMFLYNLEPGLSWAR